MTSTRTTEPRPPRLSGVHRAWWIAAVTGLIIVVVGAHTGMPGLLAGPLRQEFDWSRSTISSAFAVNMALYGLTAPFAAALMDRFGIRKVVTCALALVVGGAALTTLMTEPWELIIGWGLLVGLGAGAMALTLAATISNRWFVARRGLVSGVLTSASMFGGMVLLPALAWIVEHLGWRPSIIAVGSAALVLAPVAWLLLRDHPAELGITAYGAREFTPEPARTSGATRRALKLLRDGATTGPFWLLVATFGICGASTNGIMMTHFVPAAHENDMAITVASSLLALMGVFNVLGASGSGWLTDRFDPRWLLAAYYALRGISLAFLPTILTATVGAPLMAFVVVYGLLDLATVPPTIRLCREIYGDDDGPVIFGWVNAAHQLGAGAAAVLGGAARSALCSYCGMWLGAAALCAIGMLLAPRIKRTVASSASPAAQSAVDNASAGE